LRRRDDNAWEFLGEVLRKHGLPARAAGACRTNTSDPGRHERHGDREWGLCRRAQEWVAHRSGLVSAGSV